MGAVPMGCVHRSPFWGALAGAPVVGWAYWSPCHTECLPEPVTGCAGCWSLTSAALSVHLCRMQKESRFPASRPHSPSWETCDLELGAAAGRAQGASDSTELIICGHQQRSSAPPGWAPVSGFEELLGSAAPPLPRWALLAGLFSSGRPGLFLGTGRRDSAGATHPFGFLSHSAPSTVLIQPPVVGVFRGHAVRAPGGRAPDSPFPRLFYFRASPRWV